MIHYVCTARHSYPLGIFLAYYAGPIAEHVRLLDYPSFFRLRRLEGGVVILTDFDRLDAEDLARAGRYHDFLSGPGSPVRVLNHPKATLQRFDLLKELHARGLNSFNVYRRDDSRAGMRFPVFVRHEKGHGLIVSGLLEDAAELDRFLGRLAADPEAGDLSDLMIVEFANKPGWDGKYHKYGSFRVGDRIYLQHWFSRDTWLIRGAPANVTAEELRIHDEVLKANPHGDKLMPIFDLAGIEYGRIDYTVVDDKVAVFEINTNPTVNSNPPSRHVLYDVRPYAKRHEDAMEGLLAWGDPSRSIDIPADLRKPGLFGGDVDRAHRRTMRHMVFDRRMFDTRRAFRSRQRAFMRRFRPRKNTPQET
jgi:hypothetical protein